MGMLKIDKSHTKRELVKRRLIWGNHPKSFGPGRWWNGKYKNIKRHEGWKKISHINLIGVAERKHWENGGKRIFE